MQHEVARELVQNEKSTTQKMCNMIRVQREKSVTWKKCNTKVYGTEILQHEKSAT